jgi:hypothetical protein
MRMPALLFLLCLAFAGDASAKVLARTADSPDRVKLAQGSNQRAELIKKLNDFSQTESALNARGGTDSKSFGCYLAGKTRVIFNSGYKDVDQKTQSEWAIDLHNFILEQGGGWDNYRKYLSETKNGSALQETINDLVKTKAPNDPMDRAHISYDKQAAFADTWWKKNSQAYKFSIVPPKDWWTNDAVLDGNNLWTAFEHQEGKGGSDYLSWRDAELSTLMQKK